MFRLDCGTVLSVWLWIIIDSRTEASQPLQSLLNKIATQERKDSGGMRENWAMASRSCSPGPRGDDCEAHVQLKGVEKKIRSIFPDDMLASYLKDD